MLQDHCMSYTYISFLYDSGKYEVIYTPHSRAFILHELNAARHLLMDWKPSVTNLNVYNKYMANYPYMY